MHSTHFIYSYMVKDHTDSERGNLLPPHGLLSPISSKGSFICIIPQDNTYPGLCYTSRGTLARVRNLLNKTFPSLCIHMPALVPSWCPVPSRYSLQCIEMNLCPISHWAVFQIQPVLHDWCNKGHGMYYHICEMVHIKEPLLLIETNWKE